LIIHVLKVIPIFIKYFDMVKTQQSVFFTVILFHWSFVRSSFFTIFPITNYFHLDYLYSKILNMNNFFDNIIAKLKKEIEIEQIEIIDNSHKHAKHKSFSPDKFHLHLKIRSLYLNSLSRVTAQKEVMRVLKDELSNKIHALEISIEQ